MNDYLPCFYNVSNDWKPRWELLRTFISEWFWVKVDGSYQKRIIEPVGSWDSVQEIENDLRIELPSSVKEWVSLSQQFASPFTNFLRDDFAMLWAADESVLVIQVQCEGDIAWGIQRKDMTLIDPPVYCLRATSSGCDDSWEGTTWDLAGLENKCVTDWVMQRILNYMPQANWLNISIPRDKDSGLPLSSFTERMHGWFERTSRFGKFKIYESKNVFAGISDVARMFRLHFRKQPDFDKMPDWVVENCSDHRLQ